MKCKAILLLGILLVVMLVRADLVSDLEALGEDMPEEEKNPIGFIGKGGILMEWNINKTGAEENLDITYTIINETTTEFCIFVEKVELYSTALSLSSKDIRTIPVEKLELTNSFEIEKIAIDLSKADDEKTKQCFDVNYEKEIEGLTFKIGWNSVVIDSTGNTYSTLYTSNENMARDSNGNLFVVYRDVNSDLYFGNSSDDGITWSIKSLYAGTIFSAGIVVDSNDILHVFFYNSGDSQDFELFNSTDGGVTWSSRYTGGQTVDYIVSCISDSNNIIHCCYVYDDILDRTLSYVNSTNWDSPTRIHTDQTDDTEYCDIAVDINNNIYIVGAGADQDDLDIWASHDGWTRRQIDNDLGSTGAGYIPSITITPDNKIYVAGVESSDLQFYNSTTSQFTTTWTQKEVDTSSSYYPDISYTSDGDIYILYQGATGQTSIYRANSSDNGVTWDKRVSLHVAAYRDASIAHTLFPASNRITDTFRYVYTHDSTYDDVYFNSFEVPYTPPAVDTTPPTYSDNSTNSTVAGTDILHNLKWTDTAGLSGYIFQFCNGTWNGTDCVETIGELCYQESANESTVCGGLDSGDYSISNNWNDGDWNTGTYELTTYYVNYTIPSSVDLTSSLWQGKDVCLGNGAWSTTTNFTLYDDYNTSGKIVFKAETPFSTGIGKAKWWVWNSSASAYALLRSSNSCGEQYAYIYEEAMWWNIISSSEENWVNDSFVSMTGTLNWSNVTKTINSTVGIDYAWCVYANDTSGNWNSTSCENPFVYTSTSSGIDTCTCPASGDWNIQCSDNCDIQACDMQTNNVLLNGTGNILSLRNITNATRIRLQEGCIVRW